MEKRMLIEGMKCAHCKARVEKALQEVQGVASAEVNLETKTAVIRLTEEVNDSALMDAVAGKGFTPVQMI